MKMKTRRSRWVGRAVTRTVVPWGFLGACGGSILITTRRIARIDSLKGTA